MGHLVTEVLVLVVGVVSWNDSAAVYLISVPWAFCLGLVVADGCAS